MQKKILHFKVESSGRKCGVMEAMLFLTKNNKRLFENAIFAVVLNFLFVLYNANQ